MASLAVQPARAQTDAQAPAASSSKGILPEPDYSGDFWHRRYFDGGKTYKVTLPAPIPAARFWSFNVYDNQHRSFLETDQNLAGLDSTQSTLKKNADGSVTVYFVPKALPGQEDNWV